ncbi:hypothetical protein [Sphingomonas montana]|uniref:hypothetical protein n=1 Tax=Sphingomonas montana TaxID=1843236 RepID=UPI00096EC1DE|nr:hypothetical protein [Sphingomonas montana]
MGHLVNLVLRRSNLPFRAEDDGDDATWLSAVNGLPLFWLSLISEQDLAGQWEHSVRAYQADPDEHDDGLPSIRVSWHAAEAMLNTAEAGADQRVPALCQMFGEWATAVRALGHETPLQEVLLDLGAAANFCESIDDFMLELTTMVRVWHGDDVVVLPVISSVANDLTGFDALTGLTFPREMPAWQPEPSLAGCWTPRQNSAGRWDDVKEWGMALLCAATVMAGALLGDWLYAPVGRWIGGLAGLGIFSGLTWRWVTRR